MGRYFNPPTPEAVIEQGGRKLDMSVDPFSQLQPGEHLGWMLDRGIFKFVADVTDVTEFSGFFHQTTTRQVVSLGLYAIPMNAPGWDYKIEQVTA